VMDESHIMVLLFEPNGYRRGENCVEMKK
jgi:hypothetical protein